MQHINSRISQDATIETNITNWQRRQFQLTHLANTICKDDTFMSYFFVFQLTHLANATVP